MPRTLSFLAMFLALAGLTATALADNWDRFRGPNGTGVVNDKNIPLTFGPKENLLWKVAIPGVGNSSPVIWGNRLFLQSAGKDGKERTLYCIDTADGKTLWQKSIPGVFVKIRGDSSFASATPTTDGEAVYVPFWNGKDIILAAYDFAGNQLWTRNLGPFNTQHGAGASPILYKDKLIFANDMDREDFNTKKPNDRPSILIALNKKTGEVMWETPRDAERACYSAPFLLQKLGQTEPELVVVSTTAITGYNLADGTRSWEAKNWQGTSVKMPLRTVASTALCGDVLIACSGDGSGDRLAIGLALPGAGSAATPRKLWENKKDLPYVPCPLAHGDHVYFVNDKGFAGCYEAKTGNPVWYERVAEVAFTASPLLIDGKIYAISDTGEAFVIAADSSYRLLAHNSLGERVRATPAVADGRLFIRSERSLFCIGKK